MSSEPIEIFLSDRFRAVSRMRVAMMRSSSNGALASEKARLLPSASSSGGGGEGEVPGLSWREGEAGGLFEVKDHGAGSNFFAALQLDGLRHGSRFLC
jgi:hypothetical protein